MSRRIQRLIFMILLRSAISAAVHTGDIVIRPFEPQSLNPNSYNYRIGPELLAWSPLRRQFGRIRFPGSGLLLNPGQLYLGSTLEHIGSRKYATLLLGRSSIGRLGLFVNITADLGHVGSEGQWTLELRVIQPLRIYPRQTIGQVSFWVSTGRRTLYDGSYKFDIGPKPSKRESLLEIQ
jgi:dCTP deaminase